MRVLSRSNRTARGSMMQSFAESVGRLPAKVAHRPQAARRQRQLQGWWLCRNSNGAANIREWDQSTHWIISTHVFRHTDATWLLGNGMDILSVQKVLGHKNLESTMIYLPVIPSELAREAAAVFSKDELR